MKRKHLQCFLFKWVIEQTLLFVLSCLRFRLWGTANYKCGCSGEVNLFWFCRVAVDYVCAVCIHWAPAMMGSDHVHAFKKSSRTCSWS